MQQSRFSAKEEKHRLVASPLLKGQLGSTYVGLENHLNYIYGLTRNLDSDLAYGIAALMNSSAMDQYFRLSSGNTQVSATELRHMPLPDEEDIRSVGEKVRNQRETRESCDIEGSVRTILIHS
jgi:adenine-specific DNA-methyltransferase